MNVKSLQTLAMLKRGQNTLIDADPSKSFVKEDVVLVSDYLDALNGDIAFDYNKAMLNKVIVRYFNKCISKMKRTYESSAVAIDCKDMGGLKSAIDYFEAASDNLIKNRDTIVFNIGKYIDKDVNDYLKAFDKASEIGASLKKSYNEIVEEKAKDDEEAKKLADEKAQAKAAIKALQNFLAGK